MCKDDPDYEIEMYWLSLKKSMMNVYETTKIFRPIYVWSDKLNHLKKEKKYGEIEKHIIDYISLFALDLFRIQDNYQLQILITNIKRWNKIAKKYTFSSNKTDYHNFIYVLLDIYSNLSKTNLEINYLFTQVELYLLNKDYNELIEFSIKYNKPNVLDKLLKYDISIYDELIRRYNLPNEVKSCKYSGKKLFNLINSNNSNNSK